METIDKDVNWYAIQVRARFEKAVARNLHDKGYEEFLPLYQRRSQWSDRVKEIELPLFPGYVFCKFNVLNRLPILMIPGVNTIVGVGKNPMPVDEFELNNVRTILNSGSHCEPWPFLEVGEAVCVQKGPFTGAEGIVVMLKNTYRLVISVNLLQRSVAVEIDRDCLKGISTTNQSVPPAEKLNKFPIAGPLGLSRHHPDSHISTVFPFRRNSMAVMRKRNRLVSFRLSDQEYEALQNFTVNGGARSISDFARSALCGVLDTTRLSPEDGGSGNNQNTSPFNQTVERLVTTMGELNRVISKLNVLVEAKSSSGEGQ